MTSISEVAFLDAGLPGLELVLRGLRPGVEAVLVGGRTPVSAQVAGALLGRTGLAAIHVMAHGAPGRVELGGETLTAATLPDAADGLSAIGAALAPGGRLLLWSCCTASGAEGSALVAARAAAAGAPVAASSAPIGAAALG